jgi:hypothetical protein
MTIKVAAIYVDMSAVPLGLKKHVGRRTAA